MFGGYSHGTLEYHVLLRLIPHKQVLCCAPFKGNGGSSWAWRGGGEGLFVCFRLVIGDGGSGLYERSLMLCLLLTACCLIVDVVSVVSMARLVGVICEVEYAWGATFKDCKFRFRNGTNGVVSGFVWPFVEFCGGGKGIRQRNLPMSEYDQFFVQLAMEA